MTYSDTNKKFTIGAQQGRYSGVVTNRTYDIEVYNIIPIKVLLNNETLSLIEANSGEGWWFEDEVVHLHLDERSAEEETVIIFKEATASVEDVDVKSGMKLYPNPSKNNFHLELRSFSENISVSIYDIQGKNLHEEVFKNQKNITVNTPYLSHGIYVVNAKTEKGVFSAKLLIQ